MKKLITLLTLVILAQLSFGQSQRMVLIEEATNASCGPCASQNPAFDALLNQNRDVLTAIKYHWYFPGYDPMHNHNVDENKSRVGYYGINGVPTAAIDGVIPNGPTFSYPGGPHGYTQALIDQHAAVPSPFNIYVSHYLSPDEDIIYVDMMIEATDNVSGFLKAHMVVIEKEIHFSSPPGSNGETDFLDVMKKMIPNANGTNLQGSFETGDYVILQGSWELANIYDMDNLAVVCFIQDHTSKEVFQAANSSTEPLTPLYAIESSVTEINNVTETNCMGLVAPKVTIRNQGSDELTSVDIKYHVNGEEIFSQSWSGNLSFLETDVVDLPEIEFTVEEINELVIYLESPNGATDEYVKNDTLVQVIEQAEVAPETVSLMIRTDNNPEEITWDIMNSSGEVVLQGGPYTDPGATTVEELTLPYYDCFLFHIYDAGGDGIQVPGFYVLYHGTSSEISAGFNFGEADSAYFEGNTAVAVPEFDNNMTLQVYPNPFSGSAKLAFFTGKEEKVVVSMFNILGERVKYMDMGTVQAGPQEITLTNDNLKAGLYFIKVAVGNTVITEKVTIR